MSGIDPTKLEPADVDDHVALWAMGDINDAKMVHDWETVVLAVVLEAPNGNKDYLKGVMMHVKGTVGLDFSTSFEETIFLPDEAARGIAEHILKTIDTDKTKVVAGVETLKIHP